MRIAARTNGIIVNADSAQVYRDLRILTARPDAEDEAAQPHRLFGYIDGAEACSAARWAADAKTAIAKAHSRARPTILVGGTGLYHRTLLDGLAPIPDIDTAIRTEIRAMPVSQAYDALKREDTDAAARLDSADTTRIGRALEVIRSTGRSITAWQREKVGGIEREVDLTPLILLPDRNRLYARCDARFADMFDNGAIDEVRRLLARALDPNLPVMRAIGVAEIASFLSGEQTRDESIAAAAQATRRYAKRQYTWFANQPPSDWPRTNENNYSKFEDYIVIKLLS